jgi:hypothetical protein
VIVKAPEREEVTLVIVDSRDLSALRWDTPSALRSVRSYAWTDSSAESSTYKTAHADARLRILMHDLSVGAIYWV